MLTISALLRLATERLEQGYPHRPQNLDPLIQMHRLRDSARRSYDLGWFRLRPLPCSPLPLLVKLRFSRFQLLPFCLRSIEPTTGFGQQGLGNSMQLLKNRLLRKQVLLIMRQGTQPALFASSPITTAFRRFQLVVHELAAPRQNGLSLQLTRLQCYSDGADLFRLLFRRWFPNREEYFEQAFAKVPVQLF